MAVDLAPSFLPWHRKRACQGKKMVPSQRHFTIGNSFTIPELYVKACCLCGTPTFSYLNGKSKMLGRMVRFASNTPSEAAHTAMAALTMRVQRTHHRELENARRTRLDIVAKDSSKRLAK